jgi:hypothetical protein
MFGGDTEGLFGGDTESIFGGDLESLFGGDTESIFGGDTESLFGGDTEGLFGGDTESLFGGDTEGLFGGDTEGLFGGGELTVENAKALGAARPHAFTACVIGTPGCGPVTSGTNNKVRTSWQAPTFGHVFRYHVYKVTGAAVTTTTIGTKVEVSGSPTTATTLIDPQTNPGGKPFTYFATAEFDEETPHTFSGASNSVTVTR